MRRRWLASVLRPSRRMVDLGPVDGVPRGNVRVFGVGKEQVAVFRTRGGEVFATEARCPVGGESLGRGQLAARMVLCPDGFAFNLRTGTCVGGTRPSLRTYATRVSDGHIFVDVDR